MRGRNVPPLGGGPRLGLAVVTGGADWPLVKTRLFVIARSCGFRCSSLRNPFARVSQPPTMPLRSMESLIELVIAYRQAGHLALRMRLAEEIFRRIGPSLYDYVHRRVPEVVVDDIYQEVLLDIAKRLHTTDADTDQRFWAWCYRIAFRRCADFHRHRPPEVALDIEELRRVLEAGTLIEPPSAGERQDLEYALSLLEAAKPPCLELLWDHYVLDLDYADLAEAPGETNDAVRMRISRCLELARILVAKKG